MRIKSKPQDFRVHELLDERYVGDRGRFRVYRVTKKKLTSLEAASELALATGVRSSDVGMAGMKDRQGVTTQFMSVRGGRPVSFQTQSLKVETVGFATHALSSRDSLGNGFEIALRGVDRAEHDEIEREARDVRAHGVPNYFGEQRFGNLRHGQGWVAKELALGNHEGALKNLLAAPSENDNPHMRSFKRGLTSAWGDWKRCRDVAGAYGAHHSVFEHLAHEPEDFAGAFRYVKSALRLIHLYAFQSHVWNRAVARFVSETSRPADRLIVPSIEGPLAFARAELAVPAAWNGMFRMPGVGLEDVEHDDQRRWLVAALASEGLSPEQFRIEGVEGFALKGEDRALVVHPRRLEIFPDRWSEGVVHASFDLPRGSYATLVLARLAPTREAETPHDAARRMRREDEREMQRRDDDRADRYARGGRGDRAYGDRPYGDRRFDDRAPSAPRWGERPRDDRGERPDARRGPRHDRDSDRERGDPHHDARGHDAPRDESRRDEPRRYEPGRDETRRDGRRDGARSDRPGPRRPRDAAPRPEVRRLDARRAPQRYSDLRSSERRHDGPPVEYRPDPSRPRDPHPRRDDDRNPR